MAPNISSTISKKFEKDFQKKESSATMTINTDNENGTWNGTKIYTKTKGWFKTDLKWFNIISISLFHLYFVYACFTFQFLENLKTTAWIYIMNIMGGLGVTAGAHRLWTHRSYKAKWPLKIILVICYTSAGMNNLYEWVRDHRVHHKYTDTDADPHNSKRGFFFSHVGWLMIKKHPEVIQRGLEMDMNDILADPIAAFGYKYHSILKFIFAFLLPAMVPVYGWNETWYRAFVSQIILRYIFFLNCAWTVNSAAHIWGSKPYDAHMNPTQNRWVNIMTGGEGWHNYHHVFPWDYKASEFGSYFKYNITTLFIDLYAMIGWAYDLKQPSQELVKTIAMKKGDGSYPLWSAVPYPASKIE
ncbi:acyl-CoA Delta-9 desaturase-like [Temnothorax longispinosus]|uniref:acyl-CoA Delta-9 desaturase-like n=1 Tax=Temnothorax longispinosus TaxID=300112 RepID=UPI003A995438